MPQNDSFIQKKKVLYRPEYYKEERKGSVNGKIGTDKYET